MKIFKPQLAICNPHIGNLHFASKLLTVVHSP